MSNNRTPKRLLIDFDRVVHKYSKGWNGGKIYDKPVKGAIQAIKRLQKEGFEVVIFTTKSTKGITRNNEIEQWLKDYGIKIKVTWEKLPAIAIIDDRAIRFTNWIDIIHYFI